MTTVRMCDKCGVVIPDGCEDFGLFFTHYNSEEKFECFELCHKCSDRLRALYFSMTAGRVEK